MLKFATKPQLEEEVNSMQPKTGMPPFVQLTAEAIEDPNISAGALRLYLLLLLYSRGFGACWPSQAELARRLGVSERTIRTWLTKLVEAGYITIERSAYPSNSSSGEGQSNVYHLLKLVKRQLPASNSIHRPSSSDLSEEPVPVSRPAAADDKVNSSGAISRSEVITRNASVEILPYDQRQNTCAQGEKEISGGNEPSGKIFPLPPEEYFLPQRKYFAYKIHDQTKQEESRFKTHTPQTPTCTGRSELEARDIIPPSKPEQVTEVCVTALEIKGQEELISGAIKPGIGYNPGSAAPIQARSVVSSTNSLITASRPALALVSPAGLTASSSPAALLAVVLVGKSSSEPVPATTLAPALERVEGLPDVLPASAQSLNIMSTNPSSPNITAATNTTTSCQDGVAEIETALKAHQVAPGVAHSLALSLIKAGLGVSYVEQLAEWIEQQAQVRRIANPAGYLAWLVKQQMPIPTSAAKTGVGFATRPNSQLRGKAYDEEANPEVIKRLPELIKLAEENLQLARGAQQREEVQCRLDRFRAIEAKLKQQSLAQAI